MKRIAVVEDEIFMRDELLDLFRRMGSAILRMWQGRCWGFPLIWPCWT